MTDDIKFVTVPRPDLNPPETETYLGDGLYASFDGWQVQLRAPCPDGDHVVYLDPEVQIKLVEFFERIVGRKP